MATSDASRISTTLTGTAARWYRARAADARGGTRKAMIVALARKLLLALWRLVTTGETPEGLALRPAGGGLPCRRTARGPAAHRLRTSDGPQLTTEVAAPRCCAWPLRRGSEWARRPGASPPMRMTASWSGSPRAHRIQVCGAMFALDGELPSDRHAGRIEPQAMRSKRRHGTTRQT